MVCNSFHLLPSEDEINTCAIGLLAARFALSLAPLLHLRLPELLWIAVRWKVLTNELFPRSKQSAGFLTLSSLLSPGNQAVVVSLPHSSFWRTFLNSCLFQVFESNCFGFYILMKLFYLRNSSQFSCCPSFQSSFMMVKITTHFLSPFAIWPSELLSMLLYKT